MDFFQPLIKIKQEFPKYKNDLLSPDKYGKTIVHNMLIYDILVIKFILEEVTQKDIEKKDMNGWNILHYVVKIPNISLIETIFNFVDQKLFSQLDIRLNTIIHNACENTDETSFLFVFNYINKVCPSLFLQKNITGNTFLFHLQQINLKLIKHIFDNIPSDILFLKNKHGDTILHHFITFDLSVVKFVLSKCKTLLLEKNNFGKTILNSDIKLPVLKFLLTLKNSLFDSGEFLINFYNKNLEITKLVFDFAKQKNLLFNDCLDKHFILFDIIKNENIDSIQYVFDLFKNTNEKSFCQTKNGNNLYHSMSEIKNTQIFKYVYDYVFEIYDYIILEKNNDGDTFYHLLMKNQNFEIIKYAFSTFGVIESSDDFMLRNNKNETIIDNVIFYNKNIDIVKFILKMAQDYIH